MPAKQWRTCRLNINGTPRKLSYSDDAIKKLFEPLLRRLTALCHRLGRRTVVYLVAPADTGKTTLALFLERLALMGNASGIVPVQRLGLEGFQRAPRELAAELDAEGKPLSPYGPQAYDLEALSAKLSALASGQDIRWPVYDRARREIVPDITPVRKPIVIVEGCYIPPWWRSDFDERYLQHIRFVCLAMSDEYIDTHFDEIRSHGSDIEKRLDDSGCTRDSLKADNRYYIESFSKHGEQVMLIRSDYEKETSTLLHTLLA